MQPGFQSVPMGWQNPSTVRKKQVPSNATDYNSVPGDTLREREGSERFPEFPEARWSFDKIVSSRPTAAQCSGMFPTGEATCPPQGLRQYLSEPIMTFDLYCLADKF